MWTAAVVIAVTVAIIRVNPVAEALHPYAWLLIQVVPLGLAAVTLLVTSRAAVPRPWRAIGMAAGALVLYCTASTSWSVSPNRTISQSCVMAVVMWFLYISATRRWHRPPTRDLALLFWLGWSAIIAGMVLRYLGVATTIGIAGRLQGVLGNPNYLGMLATTVVLIGLIGYAQRMWTGRSYAAVAFAIWMSVAALLWSGSRGSILALIVGGGWLLVASPSLRRELRSGVRTGAKTGVLASVTVVVFWLVAESVPVFNFESGGNTSSADAGDLFDRSGVSTDITKWSPGRLG